MAQENDDKNIVPVNQDEKNKQAQKWWDQQKSAEKERIDQMKKRQARLHCGFSFTATTDENKNTQIEAQFRDESLSDAQKVEIQCSALCAATGTASVSYGRLLMGQTFTACFKSDVYDVSFIAKAHHEALLAMHPADEYEGMLCTRLLVLHNQYMEFMCRTAQLDQTQTSTDLNINRATKLMRLWNETLEALNRYRRKGEQKVTVQHVHVNDGGQAVVAGQVNRGGVITKSEDEPRAN